MTREQAGDAMARKRRGRRGRGAGGATGQRQVQRERGSEAGARVGVPRGPRPIGGNRQLAQTEIESGLRNPQRRRA